MLDYSDRPLTGWSDRYVKAHMALLKKSDVAPWVDVIDEFGKTLAAYIRTPGFSHASAEKQKKLLEEFCAFWSLPYALGLIQLLHQYRHLNDFDVFVDAWKTFYYKTNGYFFVHIITPSLIKTAEINKILSAFSLDPDQCYVTQKMAAHLIDGFIVECNGRRFDASLFKQVKTIQRKLSNDC